MGYDLLQRCDAVAYDALIPLELVASLPERVERHYVGRRAGRHSMPQAEKNRLLVDLALRGLNVVRLKGGDTAFFGGSAEEAECLAAAGVRVVVVPGVTAASAVAAASGLPLTDRRGASWVVFRHRTRFSLGTDPGAVAGYCRIARRNHSHLHGIGESGANCESAARRRVFARIRPAWLFKAPQRERSGLRHRS